MFGSDHYGIEPDLITIAKGLTSAYAPLSGSIVGEKIWSGAGTGHRRERPHRPWLDLFGPSDRRGGGRRQSGKLIDRGPGRQCGRDRRLSARPADAPRSASIPMWRTIRGEGLLCAVEFARIRRRVFFDPARKVGPAIAAALLERGVIGRAMPQGDILGFAPPLCLDRTEADAIVSATAGPPRSRKATRPSRLPEISG
jgi:L-2,4-diaminobutyrate transaminase